MAGYDLGFDREFILGILERLERSGRIQSAYLEHNPARLDNCHIIFHIPFSGTHTGFRWFVSIGLGRENTDPYFSTALHFTHDRPACSLDLPGCHPAWLQSLQTIFTEAHLCTAQSLASHSTAHLLAPLYTFWHQHNYYLIKSNSRSVRRRLFAYV